MLESGEKMKAAILLRILAFGFVLAFSCCYLVAQDDTIDDKDINVIRSEVLRYPPLAEAANIEGAVVLRLFLDGQGNVTKAVALSGKALLIEYSLANIKHWKFEPNNHNMAVIVYHFTIDLAACAPDFRFFRLEGNLATVTGCRRTIDHE